MLQRDKRIPMPEVNEKVRIQSTPVEGVGVYFSEVVSIGSRTIDLQIDVPHAAENTSSANGELLSNEIMVAYDRAEALYHFPARIVRKNPNGVITITKPRQITRVQRREYYRLPLQSPTTYRSGMTSGRLRVGPHAARLINLSGGGAMIVTPHAVEIGEIISIRIPVDKHGVLTDVECEVLDCRLTSHGRSRAYIVRVRFNGPPTLTPEDRDGIISYIFEQQRVMLKTRHILQ